MVIFRIILKKEHRKKFGAPGNIIYKKALIMTLFKMCQAYYTNDFRGRKPLPLKSLYYTVYFGEHMILGIIIL